MASWNAQPVSPCHGWAIAGDDHTGILLLSAKNTSPTLFLNIAAPQGWGLSPLRYSVFTNVCMAWHDSNTIIEFADDTTVVGLITDNDETAYREVPE